ncbi:hypothetical protein GlitD10_0002 [Gloeomargarita lithophora Alchichica-D10]|uniref:DUF58 domain-containing protein n=1 Tax=Gloeomargarita lithophora Alchichica-D10 TaxID=1188229 RepID=A0A1J0A8Q6_9CYAN|nr:DUF58 domain-containing protein [Gloeomargarita lithophora]APB32303.1 hypothetical protein GlitD10_0002 [Gloeomargarita lithophora Alchichica-D10]
MDFHRWFHGLPRRFTFTRIGGIFTGVTVLVSIGAFNTGNNLLYLLFGMLLSLMIASGVLSEEVMKGVVVERGFPGQIFAGAPALVTLKVENRKRRIPTFSITITDRLPGVTCPENYFLKVDARRTAQVSYRVTFPRRGWWMLEGYEISTRFPFDLFCKVRVMREPVSVLVYPSLGQPPNLSFLSLVGQGTRPQIQAGGDGEFLSLRDFRSGDDARRIHWKASARRDTWLLRDLERQDSEELTLYFYPVAPAATEPQRLEQGVSTCAGLAQELLQRGYPVALVTPGERTAMGRGLGHLDAILRVLAVVEFSAQPAPTPPNLTAQDRCIVLSAGGLPNLSAAQLLALVPF